MKKFAWITAAVMIGQPSFAVEPLPRQVSVSGQCSKQVTPDRGAVTLTAQFRDTDLKTAIKRTTEAYERAREGVQKLKLDDVELTTSEYQVHQVTEWENNKSVPKGFEARMGLRVVTSSIARIGDVIARYRPTQYFLVAI